MLASPQIENAEGRIILNFASLDDAMRLFQPWHDGRQRLEAAGQIRRALEAVGLTVEVRVKGRAVAEVGSGGLHGSMMRLIESLA
jgi:hypothetical protein